MLNIVNVHVSCNTEGFGTVSERQIRRNFRFIHPLFLTVCYFLFAWIPLANAICKVMGQILPGVPVWSMTSDSRWPGLPLVVFPGNVGGKEALAEAMIKVRRSGPSSNVY